MAAAADAPEIFVVGSANVDLCTYSAELPKPGETLLGHLFVQGFGGKGANQAVIAAKLGARVDMLGKVGDDSMGRDTLRNFEAVGVRARFLSVEPGIATGMASILVDSHGRNSIVVVPGANERLKPADVEAEAVVSAIRASRVLVGQCEIGIETTRAALHIAKADPASGPVTLMNLAPAPEGWDDDLCRVTDILCVNETEAVTISGAPAWAEGTIEGAYVAGEAILRRGVQVVLVTLGAAGCALVMPDAASPGGVAKRHIPAPLIEHVVDTTGAGDAFVGSLAFFLSRTPTLARHALSRPAILAEAVHRAVCVAADTVTRKGTQSSYPTAADVGDALLRAIPE